MITTVVIQKIIRGVFAPRRPVQVMIGFYDSEGALQATQLISATLFGEDITEGQAVDFRKPPPAPIYVEEVTPHHQ